MSNKYLRGPQSSSKQCLITLKFILQHQDFCLFSEKKRHLSIRLLIETDLKFTKKRLQHWCFPLKFVKFLKNPYFEEHLRTTASEETSEVMAKNTSQMFQTKVLFI